MRLQPRTSEVPRESVATPLEFCTLMKWCHLAFLVTLIVGCAFASTTPEVIELREADFVPTIRHSPEAVWLVELYVLVFSSSYSAATDSC